MKKYIDSIAPIIDKIIKMTELKQMKWEKSGNNTYRCVDVKDSLSLEISGGNGFVGSNIGSYIELLINSGISAGLSARISAPLSIRKSLLLKPQVTEMHFISLFRAVRISTSESPT